MSIEYTVKEMKMSDSEIASWLIEMRGLFNIFLGYIDNAEEGRREGVDRGVNHVSPESRAKLAENAGVSHVTDEYVMTSVGLFVMRMKKAWAALPLLLKDLKQVRSP